MSEIKKGIEEVLNIEIEGCVTKKHIMAAIEICDFILEYEYNEEVYNFSRILEDMLNR